MHKIKITGQKALRFSQNFLTSPVLIKRIVRIANIHKSDHVLEIGPGKGNITAALLPCCAKLTAVELDAGLYGKLKEKFSGAEKLCLLHADFLRAPLPAGNYKVFANIPFNQTSAIMEKLFFGANPPGQAWLVMEKGAAKRFMGKAGESRMSLLLKPYYEMEVKYHFRRTDFHPSPSVDAVLICITKKETPDFPLAQKAAYARFVSACISGNKGGIYNVLSKKQVSKALRLENLPALAPMGNTSYVQWLCLFRCFLKFGQK